VWLLLQVAKSYLHLVTSINNADTVITLIVPSVMIIFSNVRISIALSQFYRDRQMMLAQPADTDRDDAAAAATQGLSISSRSRSLLRNTSLAVAPPATPANSSQQCSFNQLNMKVDRELFFCYFGLIST